MFQELLGGIQGDMANMFRIQVTKEPPPPEPPRGIERGPGDPDAGSPVAPNGSDGNGHRGVRTPVAAGSQASQGRSRHPASGWVW